MDNMRASTTSILIVSDVQACLGYENLLRRNNFRNIHSCRDGVSALQKMEHEHPQVLITDARIPDMDGFELASTVREIERSENRFSYITLISDENLHNKIEYSWQANVDAIVPRETIPFRLAPQIMAGERLSMQVNALMEENVLLKSRCGYLEAGQLLDPLTGLGNRRQAMKGMEDTIRQIEARGGAIALLLIRMMDLDEILSSHGEEIADELVIAVGHKIRRLVRPLDIVTHFDRGIFGVVMQHGKLEDCANQSYQRITESLALKSYQTRAGYLKPTIRIGGCGAGAETGPPKTACLVATAMGNIDATKDLKISVLNPFKD